MKNITTSEYTVYYGELKSLLFNKYERIKKFNNLFYLYCKLFKKELDELNKITLDINFYSAFNQYYYEHYLDDSFSFDNCTRYGKAKIKYQTKLLQDQNQRFAYFKKFYISEDKANLKKLNEKFHLIIEKYDSTLNCYNVQGETIFNNALLYYCCNNVGGLDAVLNYQYNNKKKDISNIKNLIAKIKAENSEPLDENTIHYQNVLKDKKSIDKERQSLAKRIEELKKNYSNIIDEYQSINNKSLA